MPKDFPVFSVANQKFNVIILAAGLGTRLRPETDFIPKPLVELAGQRAIDFLIRKYQHVADRIVIATAHCADLMENYCRGKYPSMNLAFSREEVSRLCGPGTSLLYALDCVSTRLPTIVTFCDYLLEDQFSIEQDAVCVCRPEVPEAILDSYKTVAVVEDRRAVDLRANPDIARTHEHGFTGVVVCHQTMLLKALAYSRAVERGAEKLDYAMDIVKPYLARVPCWALPVSRIFEFGTEESLRGTRAYLDGTGRISG
jgi:NDP-sugar pyrophosphorylase family protein